MTNTISRYDFESAIENVAHTIYENYSGRGMFGSTCFGVVVEGPLAAGSIKSELHHEAERVREEVADMDEVDDEWADGQEKLADDLERLAESISHDNLGHDVIVYFPGWEFED